MLGTLPHFPLAVATRLRQTVLYTVFGLAAVVLYRHFS